MLAAHLHVAQIWNGHNSHFRDVAPAGEQTEIWIYCTIKTPSAKVLIGPDELLANNTQGDCAKGSRE